MTINKEICAIVPGNQKGLHPLVYGMGFLVTAREVLTAAHVVLDALGQEWLKGLGKIRVCFPSAEGAQDGFLCINGKVDKNRWFPPQLPRPNQPADVAVIELEENAPSSVKRASVRDYQEGAQVKIYGFRVAQTESGPISHKTGEIISGIIQGSLIPGWGQFDGTQVTGATVEKGFSGAGIYDPRLDAVVGMIVSADLDKPRKIAQFVDKSLLEKAFMKHFDPSASVRPTNVPDAAKFSLGPAREKMHEIKTYLQEIAQILPAPDPDRGLIAFIETILLEKAGAENLRAAFGFNGDPHKLRSTFALIKDGEASVRMLLGSWAQRINQSLWRYSYTLEYIQSSWSKNTRARVEELRNLCEPYLLARQPNLKEISAVLDKGSEDLKNFIESAPDPTLYAVMRSFEHTHEDRLDGSEAGSDVALNFLFNYVQELLKGNRSIDDSSNAWWAVRIGICRQENRFLDLLPPMAEKFSDIRVPGEEVSRLAPLPEIYKPVRTCSYTLSNIQAILECQPEITAELKDRLHQILATMLDRLLKTPRSNHLYLASVHHEGLRNYLDYLKDQGVTVDELGLPDSTEARGSDKKKD